jgi:hypothetical protein
MPILNKPAFVKGQNNQITLSKSDLAQQVSDLYFQDSANWKQVVLFYETSEGKQRKVLVYDASQGTPAANFNISQRARDEWQIKRVVFYDFDGGSLTLKRDNLTVSEFDISLDSTPPSAFLPFTRTFDSAQGSIDTSEYYEEIQVENGSANIDLITNSLVISITDTLESFNGFIWGIGSGQATTLHNMTGNVVVEVDYNNSSHKVGFKAVSYSSGGLSGSSATVETDDISGQGTLQLILDINDVSPTSVTDFSVQLVDSFSNFPVEEEFTINITEIRIIAQE